jgi:hypothetical protein
MGLGLVKAHKPRQQRWRNPAHPARIALRKKLPLLRLVWVAGFPPAPATPSEGHLRTHFIKPVVVPVGLVGERPESVGNLWAAPTRRLPTARTAGGAVHGLSTRPAGLGPVRRTRPQVHRQMGWGYHLNPTALFTAALGLQAPWGVADVTFDRPAGRIDFQVAFTPGARFACPHCGAEHQPVHDTQEREWRHLNFFQFEAYLHAKVPRVRCETCAKTTQIAVPWARANSGFPSVPNDAHPPGGTVARRR